MVNVSWLLQFFMALKIMTTGTLKQLYFLFVWVFAFCFVFVLVVWILLIFFKVEGGGVVVLWVVFFWGGGGGGGGGADYFLLLSCWCFLWLHWELVRCGHFHCHWGQLQHWPAPFLEINTVWQGSADSSLSLMSVRVRVIVCMCHRACLSVSLALQATK